MKPRCIAALTAIFIALGCDTRVGLEGATGGGALDGGGFPPVPSQLPLVGEWSLILLNRDASGTLISAAETRWRFDASGSAIRSSIATSFVTGIQEVVSATGRWSATATTVTIVLDQAGTLVLPWRIERQSGGDVLVLGTLSFARRS